MVSSFIQLLILSVSFVLIINVISLLPALSIYCHAIVDSPSVTTRQINAFLYSKKTSNWTETVLGTFLFCLFCFYSSTNTMQGWGAKTKGVIVNYWHRSVIPQASRFLSPSSSSWIFPLLWPCSQFLQHFHYCEKSKFHASWGKHGFCSGRLRVRSLLWGILALAGIRQVALPNNYISRWIFHSRT